MIEIHCNLRCACGAYQAAVVQMRIAEFLAINTGGLRFTSREQMTLLDIGDWKMEAGSLRCPRCLSL